MHSHLGRLKGSAFPYVVPKILGGILSFDLSLCTVKITKLGHDTIVLEKSHELSVEHGLRKLELRFKGHLFHDAIEDCACVSPKETECIDVHADYISC